MPSPIAHLSVGYVIYRYYKRKYPESPTRIWKLPLQLILVSGLSLLPDLDVIPAIIFGDMQRYHNNFSHSILFAIPVSFVVAGVLHRASRSDFWLWFVVCSISYDLHVIMDALTDGRGVMMFWPLTEARFASPMNVFIGLHWGEGWLSIWHLWTILTESLFGLIAFLAIRYFDKRRNQKNTVISS
jgi:LexA-binding, inner membrane-associated putative hydrolase